LKSPADLTQSDVERVLEIVDRLNDIEVRIEVDGMKLHVRKFSDPSMARSTTLADAARAGQPVASTSTASLTTSSPQAEALSSAPTSGGRAPVASGLLEVRAPMLGRFFRSSSPSDPPYVDVGSRILAEDTVCMIEVMKLFNTVSAGVSGTIVEILVENGAMVEHDAVLFRVRPE
jgi:acetyl-CoA carboxylase biotin carboxyl carrier protein